MKWFLTILLCLAIMLGISFAWGQRVGGGGRQANTLSPVPIQVMGEGRLTNIAVGTGLVGQPIANVSNSFSGYWQTNATWGWYTNSQATGAPVVGAIVSLERQVGFYQPTVSTPNDDNAKNWLTRCASGSNDICPQATFKNAGLRPVVMVMGFQLIASNWSGLSFRGYDVVRMGQSPYVICQLNDNLSDVPATGIALWVHTPDGAGVGGAVVVLDNGEIYQCMLLYDAFQDKGALRVYQKLTNGRYLYKGESLLPLTASTAAENVFLSMHDDHSPLDPTGPPGDIRVSHFWMSTNREIFYNNQFPPY